MNDIHSDIIAFHLSTEKSRKAHSVFISSILFLYKGPFPCILIATLCLLLSTNHHTNDNALTFLLRLYSRILFQFQISYNYFIGLTGQFHSLLLMYHATL